MGDNAALSQANAQIAPNPDNILWLSWVRGYVVRGPGEPEDIACVITRLSGEHWGLVSNLIITFYRRLIRPAAAAAR